jgi:hypothetical protein
LLFLEYLAQPARTADLAPALKISIRGAAFIKKITVTSELHRSYCQTAVDVFLLFKSVGD